MLCLAGVLCMPCVAAVLNVVCARCLRARKQHERRPDTAVEGAHYNAVDTSAEQGSYPQPICILLAYILYCQTDTKGLACISHACAETDT